MRRFLFVHPFVPFDPTQTCNLKQQEPTGQLELLISSTIAPSPERLNLIGAGPDFFRVTRKTDKRFDENYEEEQCISL
jgi:hypothetical protein